MLVDVFLYNDEREMADLRVRTLRDHVDVMVAVCCDLTHQSEPNPLPEPLAGVEQVCVPATPIPDGRGGQGTDFYQWIERQHRDGMRQAVEALNLSAADVVMISDVDEIPDPASLPDITLLANQGPCSIPMRMHGFALDYLYPLGWMGTTASRADAIAPQAHRNWRHKIPRAGAGWHLSWFGDLDEKERKLRSFSHAELHDLDVEACWRNGTHANGERMTHLSREVMSRMDWPAPLFDDFTIPASWWAPQEA